MGDMAEKPADPRGLARRDARPLTVAALVLCALFTAGLLIYFFRPELLFSTTTTTGGDTGSHINWAWYLKRNLLPHGRVVGWAQDWYAGFPLLQFYFPLPFLLIAGLSYLLPYTVAFKLVTVLGVLGLPVALWGFARLLRLPAPLPALMAAFSVPFLFMESYSIYGGNILSNLAGEFGHGISLLFGIPLLGIVWRGIPDRRFKVLGAVLFAAVCLTHLVTAIFVVSASAYLVIERAARTRREFFGRIGYFVLTYGLGGLLAAWWMLPFAAKLPYSTHMSWTQLEGIGNLFPPEILWALPFAALGIVGAVRSKGRAEEFLLWLAGLPLLLYIGLPDGRIWNGRFLPFFYLGVYVLAAYGVYTLRRPASLWAWRAVRLPRRYGDATLVAVTVLLIVGFAGFSARAVPAWIEWNYTGYEGKAAWPTFEEINEFMASQPPGRVMWEHAEDNNDFGTSQAFSTLPYFAGQPTMEAILIESAMSAPFHFINQAELSDKSSRPVQGISYPRLDLADGVEHLRLFNVPYYISVSASATAEAEKTDDLIPLKRFDRWAVWGLDTSGTVVVPAYRPVVADVRVDEWRDTALRWYRNSPALGVPIVREGAGVPDEWTRIPTETVVNPPKVPVPGGVVSDVRVEPETISFHTTAIGQPHWVKVSYFPNWRAEGADGPFLASPAFMVVVPHEEDVRLTYERLPVDRAGIGLSGLAVGICALAVVVPAIRRRRRPPVGPQRERD